MMSGSSRTKLMLLGAIGLAGGCAAREPQEVTGASGVRGTVQELRSGHGKSGSSYLGMDILATDASGAALPCEPRNLEVKVTATVEATGESLELPDSSLRVECSNRAADVAIVVDNSGSEKGQVPLQQSAIAELAGPVLEAGGRVSIVRVSTNATLLSELTSQTEDVEAASDSLFVSNGWTALYDGIRMANDSLVRGNEGGASDAFANARSFCSASRKRAIAVVTDGADNNSAAERLLTEFDDGVATTFKDVSALRVEGITTPLLTVGVGDRVDEEHLTQMAETTGGTYVSLESFEDLPRLFSAFAEYPADSYEVCSSLPRSICGKVVLTTQYRLNSDDGVIEGTRTETIDVECDTSEPDGPVDVPLPGGGAGCDYGDALSAATNQSLDLFGAPVYFNDGASLPAGEYILKYEDGCMKYNAGQAWALHAYAQNGGRANWWIVAPPVSGNTPVKVAFPPGSVGYQLGRGGFATFEECVAANRQLATMTIQHTGGPLGVWLDDSPYADNVAGSDGRNPKWSLTKVGECSGPKDVTLPGDLPGCDYGGAASAATRQSLDLFGTPVYFNDGASLPEGDYIVSYEDGCMKYNANQAWAVHAGGKNGIPSKWWFVTPPVTPNGKPVKAAFPPGTIGYQLNAGGFATFDACVAANKALEPAAFHHAGGPLGVWLEDNPYSDNVTGQDGRNPKWRVTRVGDCP